MNKIQLFSEKATYASPSSKLIILQGRQNILNESNGDGTPDGLFNPVDEDEDF